MRTLYISIVSFFLLTLTTQALQAQSAKPVTITSTVKKSYNGNDISCNSKNDAEITVTAAGGSGTYEYSKDNGANYQSSNVLTGVPGGANCLVRVRDAKDRSNVSDVKYIWVASVNVVKINTFQRSTYFNGGGVNGVSCAYNSDGQITVKADGGTETFLYSIDNGATFHSKGLFENLSAGTYTAIAKDQNGCIAYSSPSFSPVQLTAPDPIVGNIVSQTNISCTSATGSVTVSGSGGDRNYNINIDGGEFIYLGKGKTYTFSQLTEGSHTILVRDDNYNTACMSAPIKVTIGSSFKASISGNSAICAGSAANFVINIPAGNGTKFTAVYKDELNNNFTVNNLKAGNNTITTGALSASKTFTLVSVKNETGCAASVSGSVNVTVTEPGKWLGLTNEWNDGKNWSCGAIPTSETNVTIPVTSHDPVIISLVVPVNSLTIETGASVIVKGTLQIGDKINNKGTFDLTNGTLEFNGKKAQSFSGSYFLNKTVNNLKISNAIALGLLDTKNDTLNITGKIFFGVSNATFNTNDNLTLKSTSSATASIADITNNGVNSGNNITGKVTVERFINTGLSAGQHGKKWLFLSFPTQGQTVKESIMENGSLLSTGYGVQVTGAQGVNAGFDVTTPSPSVKYYDDAITNWKGITNTSAPIHNDKGFMVFVRGDRSVNGTTVKDANAATLRTKGTLAFGDQTFTVPATNNFSSIGNPYASAIDMRKVAQSSGADFFYAWNPAAGGAYGLGAYEFRFKINGDFYTVPGLVKNNLVQSGEAFFVQSNKVASSVIIKENSKATEGNGRISRVEGTTQKVSQMRTNFYSVGADGSSTLLDATLQQFDASFNNSIDEMDAKKVFNSFEGIAIKAGGKDIILERRQALNSIDTVFYSVTSLKAQNYELEFVAENVSGALQGFIEDAYLKTVTPVSLDGTTTMSFTVNKEAASYAANRFRIVFKQVAVLPVTFTSVKAYQKNEAIAVEWKVENESNMRSYEVERSNDGNKFAKVATVEAKNVSANNYSWLDNNAAAGYNYYRIKSVDLNGKPNYTQVVKVLIGKASGAISIFPNPVVNGNVNLQLVNQPAGIYYMRVLNPIGQVVISKQISHVEGSSTEVIKWDNNFAHGLYQMEITKPDGNIKTIKIMY